MSSIYSGGNHDAAIAAIKTAINARIETLADGTKDLNRESLYAWLRAQFDSMIPDGEATSGSYVASIDCSALVGGLNASIGRSVMAARSDFPNASTILSDDSIVASARENLAALDALSADVTTFYSNTAQNIVDIVSTYLQASVLSSIPSGITRIVTSSAVIATYVTDWGEESAPSPVSALFDRDQNDTFTVTVDSAPAGRHITHFRLYMANSTSSAAAFQYIPNDSDEDGWPIGTLSVTIAIKPEQLGEPCPSMTWDEPPSDLRGLVEMGNGMNVGFTGNTIVPCEPYKPYAFPPEYRKTTSHPIVGLCALDQVLVVGTQGPPKILAGSDSASLSEIKTNSGQACVSQRSMVAIGGVAIYASPDGLCAASPTGNVEVITGPTVFNLFAREDWQALTPSGIFAAELEGSYVFHVPAGVCYSLDLASGKLITITATGTAFYRDFLTDTLYLAGGRTITALFTGSEHRTALWKSKRIVLPNYTNFGWLQVNSEFEDDITVRLYRNGTLHSTSTVSDRTPVRIPPGRHVEWEVEVESSARATGVTFASTAEELRAV